MSPAALGMGKRTRLEIASEIIEAPSITGTNRVLRRERNAAVRSQMAEPDLVDETLILNSQTKMPLGYAFPSDSSRTNRQARVPVAKRLRTMADGRKVLLEAVEWRDVSGELNKLPNLTGGVVPSTNEMMTAQTLPPRPSGDVENVPFAARLAAASRSGTRNLRL